MRARGFLLAAVFVFAGCSASDQDGTAESAALAETAEAVQSPDSGQVELADERPEGLAFEAESAAEVGVEEKLLVDPSSNRASEDEASINNASPNESDAVVDGPPAESTSGEDDVSPAPRIAEDLEESTGPQTATDVRIDELIAFVEAERGYAFDRRPSIELLDNEAFGRAWTAVVADDVAENGADYINYTDIYRAMGIIDDDTTLEEIWLRFGDAGVIGFYDTDSKAIKLRSGEFNAFTETVLVHELVHALEDQVFGLDRPQYADRNDEIEWTFSALIEGSARRIETEFRSTFSAAKLAEETAARQALPRSVSLSEFTPSFLELQFGRYRHGETFANAIWSQGSSTFDDAFVNPPGSSEAILDPTAFIDNTLDPETIRQPVADGDIFESGTWGQAGWAAVFTDVVDRDAAEDAADGWGGDSFVAWRQGSATCVRTNLAADTPDQLDDYANMFEEWAAQASGRQIFYPTADLIRITACG